MLISVTVWKTIRSEKKEHIAYIAIWSYLKFHQNRNASWHSLSRFIAIITQRRSHPWLHIPKKTRFFRCISRKWRRYIFKTPGYALEIIQRGHFSWFITNISILYIITMHPKNFQILWWRIWEILSKKMIKFIHNSGKSTPKKALLFWWNFRWVRIAMHGWGFPIVHVFEAF